MASEALSDPSRNAVATQCDMIERALSEILTARERAVMIAGCAS